LIAPILTPFIIAGGTMFFLYPARSLPFVRRMMWLSAGFFLVWLYLDLYNVLVPFMIAFVLAYIFNPLVDYLETKNIPRWLSSLLIVIFIVTAIVFFFILLVPIVLAQLRNLGTSISAAVESAWNFMMGRKFYAMLQNYGIPIEKIKEVLSQELPSRSEELMKSVLTGAITILTNISAIIVRVLDIVIIPFVAFYLLWDYPRIVKGVKSIVPLAQQQIIGEYVRNTDEILGRYLRGYFILIIIQGTVATIVLSWLGVQYAVLLGIVTAVLDLIPYIGLFVPMGLAVLCAWGSGDPVEGKILGVIILYLAEHLLENTILAPRIVGKGIGLHPVVLILALGVFGHFFGLVGLLIAAPASAMLIMTVKFWKEHKAPAPENIEAVL
jgi:predicted PurR-regulated permease PerM